MTNINSGILYRYTAFSNQADGGNPAGVWVGDDMPDEATMQRVAAEVGFSETRSESLTLLPNPLLARKLQT